MLYSFPRHKKNLFLLLRSNKLLLHYFLQMQSKENAQASFWPCCRQQIKLLGSMLFQGQQGRSGEGDSEMPKSFSFEKRHRILLGGWTRRCSAKWQVEFTQRTGDRKTVSEEKHRPIMLRRHYINQKGVSYLIFPLCQVWPNNMPILGSHTLICQQLCCEYCHC